VTSRVHPKQHKQTTNITTMVMELLAPPRHGFDESTPLEWQAALRIYFPRPLLKGLAEFNILIYKLIYLYQPYVQLNLGSSASNNGGQHGIHCCWRQPIIYN
jgi:hypothetical protein